RARFFTPRSEAGFVGHATVAAQYVLSRRFDAPRWQRQKSKAGIVDIEVRGTDAERRIAIRRSPPTIGRELNDRERLAVLDALALASESLDPRIPLRIVGVGAALLRHPGRIAPPARAGRGRARIQGGGARQRLDQRPGGVDIRDRDGVLSF